MLQLASAIVFIHQTDQQQVIIRCIQMIVRSQTATGSLKSNYIIYEQKFR